MRKFIKIKLREHIGTYETQDKFELLERDIVSLVEKYKRDFEQYPNDTYGVIDAIQQVFDNLFQRVNR